MVIEESGTIDSGKISLDPIIPCEVKTDPEEIIPVTVKSQLLYDEVSTDFNSWFLSWLAGNGFPWLIIESEKLYSVEPNE